MERVRFITHRGKQVLLVDVAHCSTVDAEKAIRTVPDFVTVQPRSSVLLLVDFAGTPFNSETMRAMHENAVLDKPYINKSAWIGAESLPDSFRQGLSGYSGRDFPVFKDRIDALEWLTKD